MGMGTGPDALERAPEEVRAGGRVGAGRRSRIAAEAVGVAIVREANAVAGRVARGVGESCLTTIGDAGAPGRGGGDEERGRGRAR